MASQSSSKAPSISSKAPSLSAGPEAVTDPAPTGPIKTPLTVALPECKPTPPAALTADQETKYASVLSTVSAWTTIPSSTLKDATNEPITDNERMWLTRECLLRYL
ncbi:hypothetical protein KCU77_g24008, partial [Aureobasidium melanogenum]